MPIIESGPLKGLNAQICLNPLGVINRMNPAQNIEQEINFIGLYVRHQIKEYLDEGMTYEALEEAVTFMKKVGTEDSVKGFEDFLQNVLPDDDNDYVECVNDLLCEFVETGIPIHNYPFNDNVNFFDLCEIYEFYENRYGIENLKFKFKDIYNPMVMGELYFVKLKHSSDNKSSMRSTGFVDLLDLPSKDRLYKDFKSLYPKTPVKCGEMESMYLLMAKDHTAIKELLCSYGTSYEDEELLEYTLLNGNPFNVDIKFPMGKSKPAVVKDRLLYSIGLEIIDTDDTAEEIAERLKAKNTTKKKKSKKK
jgi:hypothetical protein